MLRYTLHIEKTIQRKWEWFAPFFLLLCSRTEKGYIKNSHCPV